MGIAVLVLGESGSGKSASLRNFKKDDVCVLNVASKPLPFKGNLTTVNNNGGADADFYKIIAGMLQAAEYKSYVIDDSQYLLVFEEFRKVEEAGYKKYTTMAKRFEQMLEYIARNTSPDTIIYLLHHLEYKEDGGIKAKTIGKMLDNKLTIEGLFSIVLQAKCEEGQYYFVTNGMTPIKSPIGMFEQKEISNDLKLVDDTIREYYGLAKKGGK